jgi:hypothetical protein
VPLAVTALREVLPSDPPGYPEPPASGSDYKFSVAVENTGAEPFHGFTRGYVPAALVRNGVVVAGTEVFLDVGGSVDLEPGEHQVQPSAVPLRRCDDRADVADLGHGDPLPLGTYELWVVMEIDVEATDGSPERTIVIAGGPHPLEVVAP